METVLDVLDSEYYVYELVDPRSTNPFYIGVGKGFTFRDTFYKIDPTVNKHTRIVMDEIVTAGLEVQLNILRENVTHEDALLFAGSLIRKHGRQTKDINGILTNVKDPYSPNKKPSGKYSAIQVRLGLRDDIRDFCVPRGIQMSDFVARMFMVAVSGSAPDYLNEILGYRDK